MADTPQENERFLQDIINHDVRLLLCGYWPGRESFQRKCYYAGANNWFWAVLHAVKMVPRFVTSKKGSEVTKYGLGLTLLMKRDTFVYRPSETQEDIDRLRELLCQYRPKILAFVGKPSSHGIELDFFHDSASWGWCDTGQEIENTRIWVVPDTSTSNRRWREGCHEEYMGYWHALAATHKENMANA